MDVIYTSSSLAEGDLVDGGEVGRPLRARKWSLHIKGEQESDLVARCNTARRVFVTRGDGLTSLEGGSLGSVNRQRPPC